MYCVKCGVRLSDGLKCCPLCQTPVWNPVQEKVPETGYSALYPKVDRTRRVPALSFVTLLLALACISCLIYCLRTYNKAFWSGYVMLGIAVFYLICILPMWFERPHPLVFVPLSFAAVCGYLLYICLYNHGRWFLSFAFPVVMITGFITTVSVALFRYVHRGKLFITGGLLISIGGCTMLVELFQCITFGTRMFTWSLYAVSAFSCFGIFLILAGAIRPMREYLERKFFM